ncbi:hypothetical protein RHSIM_Rhsim09G0006000 [Rhododendron simsii]|uniref:Pentatricopeptide repeat-containing protein n=1 Tax=Rhododendron simsii TaxID=118357 RepID=A0A834LFB8_RHOSS|nr:hypothetical protein RHSIM_Rhsim09G0006000 [Rhododendron simsii]
MYSVSLSLLELVAFSLATTLLKMETKAIFTHLANLLQFCIDKKANLSGKILHGYMLRNGLSADTFLSNRLIEFYSKCSDTPTARHLFDKMPMRNIYSWHAMLDGYCKASKLKDAREVFAAMPERNTVSWNTLISALARSGLEQEAMDVYHMMNLEGFMPTHFTLASVFSACGALVDVDCGMECHGVAIKIGLDKNVFVANALLCMYAKCRCIEDSIRAFGDLPIPNEVSFTAMMGVLADSDRVEEAFSMFRTMHRTGIRIDPVSLSSVMGVCARDRRGQFGITSEAYGFSSNMHGHQIHGLSVKLGFERDLHLIKSLLDMYAKKGDMTSAEIIFNNLPEVSVVSWNIMIGGYGQNHDTEKAMDYMHGMLHQGFEPDEVTHINMLAACVKSGDIEIGRRIFDRIVCPSLSSWNAILLGYSQNDNHKEAVKLFGEMQFRGVQPDRTTLAIITSSCAGIGLLEGLSLNSLDKEAFSLFKKMLGKGLLSTQFSYAIILTCCANLSSLSHGRQIHAQIAKDGYMTDVYVGSALINMYCKCGDVDGAKEYFDEMPLKNIVTWNEMIHGYAQNGCGEEAVSVYKDMIVSGEEPDGITFVAVLTACSHSGLVDTGIEIFNSMKLEHGVDLLLDHYTCIIDALGRAGRFHEAEVLIDRMPYKDDPIVWEVLLSSCRVHANVSLARRAAEELFRLDPQNSAPYVLLANMYSSLGRWEEAKVFRKMMGDKQISKNPGYSQVGPKNRMEVFDVDEDFRMVVDKFEAANI